MCLWLSDMKGAVYTATTNSIVFTANSVKFLSATCHFQFMLSKVLTMVDGTKLFSKVLFKQELIPKSGCTSCFKCDDYFNKCEINLMSTFRHLLDIQSF